MAPLPYNDASRENLMMTPHADEEENLDDEDGIIATTHHGSSSNNNNTPGILTRHQLMRRRRRRHQNQNQNRYGDDDDAGDANNDDDAMMMIKPINIITADDLLMVSSSSSSANNTTTTSTSSRRRNLKSAYASSSSHNNNNRNIQGTEPASAIIMESHQRQILDGYGRHQKDHSSGRRAISSASRRQRRQDRFTRHHQQQQHQKSTSPPPLIDRKKSRSVDIGSGRRRVSPSRKNVESSSSSQQQQQQSGDILGMVTPVWSSSAAKKKKRGVPKSSSSSLSGDSSPLMSHKYHLDTPDDVMNTITGSAIFPSPSNTVTTSPPTSKSPSHNPAGGEFLSRGGHHSWPRATPRSVSRHGKESARSDESHASLRKQDHRQMNHSRHYTLQRRKSPEKRSQSVQKEIVPRPHSRVTGSTSTSSTTAPHLKPLSSNGAASGKNISAVAVSTGGRSTRSQKHSATNSRNPNQQLSIITAADSSNSDSTANDSDITPSATSRNTTSSQPVDSLQQQKTSPPKKTKKRKSRKAPSPKKTNRSWKYQLYNRPITFFKHSPLKLKVKNVEQILKSSKVKQVKMPLTLIFNQRRQTTSTSFNSDGASLGMSHSHAHNSNDSPLTFSSNFETGNLQQVWRDAAGEYYLLLESDRGIFNCLWFHFMVGNLRAGERYIFNIVNISNKAHNFSQGYQPCMRVGIEDSNFWKGTLVESKHKSNAKGSSPSSKLHINHGGWTRFGRQCVYFRTVSPELKKRSKILLGQHKAQKNRKLNTLRFEFSIDSELEAALNACRTGIYISYSYPYSYATLCRTLSRISREVNKREVKFRSDILCTSVCGREVKVLTISSARKSKSALLRRSRTSAGDSGSKGSKAMLSLLSKSASHSTTLPLPAGDHQKEKNQDHHPPSEDTPVVEKRSAKKPVIFISARCHSGESSSSHTLDGILDYLCLSKCRIARVLRANFIFRIVPMLNPDGVVEGLQRMAPTSSSKANDEGVNLNECYNSAEKKAHPTIFATKRLMKKLSGSRDIVLYLDLHGHYNANIASHFVYGYTKEENVGNTNLQIYKFAQNLEQECRKYEHGEEVFKYKEEFIRANNSKKQGIAPVFFSSELGVANAFTVETCMHTTANYQLTPTDYYNFGRCLCNTIYTTFQDLIEP